MKQKLVRVAPRYIGGALMAALGLSVAAPVQAQPYEFMFGVARFLQSNGQLDTTFDADGMVTTQFPGIWNERALAVDVNGSSWIVVGGHGVTNSGYRFLLARYKANGALDTSYSGDGLVSLDIPECENEFGRTMVMLPYSRALMVGQCDMSEIQSAFLLAQYNILGNFDAGFSSDGRVVTPIPNHHFASITDVAADASGRIVSAGWATDASGTRFAVTRHLANGTLDTGFHQDGVVTTGFPGFAEANAVAIDSVGRIVVGGTMSTPSGDTVLALARYFSSGTLDPTFGTQGKRTIDIPGATHERISDIAIVGSQIYCAGEATFSGHSAVMLTRHNASGSLDTSFSGDGVVLGSATAHSESLILDSQQRIYAVGAEQQFVSLWRYTSSGALDATFGNQSAGLSVANFPQPVFDYAFEYGQALDLDPAGKVVVVGGVTHP